MIKCHHLFAAALLLVLESAVGQPISRLRKQFAANAGTGPYITGIQSGLSGYDVNAESIRRGRKALIDALNRQARSLTPGRDHGQILSMLGSVNTLVDQLDSNASATISDALKNLQTSIGKLNSEEELNKEHVAAVKAQVLATDRLASIDEVVRFSENVQAALRSPTSAFKVGGLLNRDASFAFTTVTYSPGEPSVASTKVPRCARFLSGSQLVPCNGSEFGLPSHLGAGVAYGVPDTYVFGLGVGSFFSPSALDAEASFSQRLFSPPNEELKTGSNAQYTEHSIELRGFRERRLMDHVRPGDIWAAISGRALWRTRNSSPINGQIAEIQLTFALRERSMVLDSDQNPVLATTLTASGIYSPQRSLGADELGVELRTPIGGRKFDSTPVYLSSRYGTRGHWTFAIEGKF